MAVITVAQVAARGRISDTSTSGHSSDALVTTLINAVQKRAERYCLRLFDAAVHTEYRDTTAGQGFLYVNHPPITAISAVTHNEPTSPQTINHTNDVRSEADFWERGEVRLYNGEGVFYAGRGSVKLVYTGGWTSDTVPDDLADALIQQVLFELWHPEAVGVKSVRGDGAGADFERRGGFAAEVCDVLDGYRLTWKEIMQ